MKNRFALLVLAMVVAACGDVVKGSGVDAPPNNCPGAVCECTAATEAMDCGAHEICDESGGNRECKCAAGYVAGAGDAGCVFSSPLQDPGFQDPSKWTVVGGAMVNPAATGSKQPGELIFDKMTLCSFGGAKQSFTMPPFDRADPLKVSITTSIIQPPPPNFFFTDFRIQVGIGTQFIELQATGGEYKTQSFCLGPAAFGGPVEMQISPLGTLACSNTTTGSIRVDEIKLEVASPGECPRQAGVVNGNFQLATGWKFPNSQSGAGQILPNIGENGSFAAQLQQPNRCSEVTATGLMSIPTNLTNPAIDVYWNGTSGGRLTVLLNNKGIGTLLANGQIKHSRVCIPKWAVGNTTTLGFFAQRQTDNDCATPLNRTYILDNITIVNEPACGTLSDITDPSFERIAAPQGPVPGWGQFNGMVNNLEAGRIFFVNGAGVANTGTGAVRSHNANQCVFRGQSGVDIAVIVPPASGTSGPALKFFGRADPANVNSELRANIMPQTEGQVFKAVAETGAYVPTVMCFPPAMVGRLVNVRIGNNDPDGGGCAATTYDEFAFIDDVSVTTDPTCPAQ